MIDQRRQAFRTRVLTELESAPLELDQKRDDSLYLDQPDNFGVGPYFHSPRLPITVKEEVIVAA